MFTVKFWPVRASGGVLFFSFAIVSLGSIAECYSRNRFDLVAYAVLFCVRGYFEQSVNGDILFRVPQLRLIYSHYGIYGDS